MEDAPQGESQSKPVLCLSLLLSLSLWESEQVELAPTAALITARCNTQCCLVQFPSQLQLPGMEPQDPNMEPWDPSMDMKLLPCSYPGAAGSNAEAQQP